jgi:hypothetical protein
MLSAGDGHLRREASFQVDLAEFNALRAEIQTFLTLQSAFLALAVAIIAAAISVFAEHPEKKPELLAAAPLPFAVVAILYADVVARIGRAARYIQTKLRPRLAKQTAPDDALGWEQYVHQDDPNLKLLRWTDKGRYAMVFLPALLAYVASFWWPIQPALRRWDLFFKIVNGIAVIGAAIVIVRSEMLIEREILSKP